MEYYLNEYIVPVLGALVALIATWVVAGWVRRLIRDSLKNAEFDLTLTRFFSTLAYYAVLVFGILSALTLFGISIASFAAVQSAWPCKDRWLTLPPGSCYSSFARSR